MPEDVKNTSDPKPDASEVETPKEDTEADETSEGSGEANTTAADDEAQDELADDELRAWEDSAARRAARRDGRSVVGDAELESPDKPSTQHRKLSEELDDIRKDIESIDGVTDPKTEFITRALRKISDRIDALQEAPATKPKAATKQADPAATLHAIIDTMPANNDGFFDDEAQRRKLVRTAQRMLEDDRDDGKVKGVPSMATEMKYLAKAALRIKQAQDDQKSGERRAANAQARHKARTPAGTSTQRGGGGGVGPPPKPTGNIDKDIRAQLAYVEKKHAAKRAQSA